MPKPDVTGKSTGKKVKDTRFQPGESGNSLGRPLGSRNRLSEKFLDALCRDWEEHGPAVLKTVREDDPAAYLRVAASLLPKQSEVSLTSDLSHLSDEQLQAKIKLLAAKLGDSVNVS